MTVTIGPRRYDAVISGLDGVIDAASVHADARKEMFDAYLTQRPPRAGEDHSPLTGDEYRRLTARAALHRPIEITCREQTSTLTPRSNLWFPF